MSLSTNRLFWGAVVLWLCIAVYTNERVLPPEVMADIVRQTTNAELSSSQLDRIRRQGRWAYALLPLLLLCRVGVAALVLQLVAMLKARDLPYATAFKAGLLGFFAILHGIFVRILRLDLMPAGQLTRADVDLVPDSLAALFPEALDSSFAWAILSVVSLHDALWIGAVALALAGPGRLPRRVALTISASGWAIMAVARAGGQVFVVGLTG